MNISATKRRSSRLTNNKRCYTEPSTSSKLRRGDGTYSYKIKEEKENIVIDPNDVSNLMDVTNVTFQVAENALRSASGNLNEAWEALRASGALQLVVSEEDIQRT